MKLIALVDMRSNNGQVVAIMDDEANLTQFPTCGRIRVLKRTHPLGVFPWRAVELETGTVFLLP